jgi:two-component system, OmpR family, sensor histidine kinase KdpD
MRDLRPNPDDLLDLAAKEAARSGHGQLKIFFGACAGVGKTYAMLQAARQRQAEGVSVGIGVVETHDRGETRALLNGMTEIPSRVVDYGGRVVHEFDLDQALTAGLQLVLVDELAHTNAPGSRHAKRWQDVEELLEAGIDVYTTLNVQHLDSLNDIVGGIIGIRVRETVPDRVFDTAADVVLVDLPPDDLLARLDAGKVYLPVSANHARQNFFRKGNLIALRELALRRVADRVNTDVRSYRTYNAIRTIWPTRERLMVCVRADPSQENLMREAARLAQRLQADWIVVHVDQPNRDQEHDAREVLLNLAKSAETLGAEFANVPGEDIVGTLLDYARARNATKLVMGFGTGPSKRPWRLHLSEQIARADPGLDLVLLNPGKPTAARARPKETTAPTSYARSLGLATLVCGLTTFVAGELLRVFDLSNVVMLFLVTVVFVALRLGRVAGVWAALMSVACLDFFFVEPRLSFAVSDTQYIFTFALMLVVALVTSQLAVRLQVEAKVAVAGERRASVVARVARDLSAAIRTQQIAATCADTIASLFGANVALLLPDAADRLMVAPGVDFVDIPVAQWAYDHGAPAGLGTQTLNGAGALYLPLKAPMRSRGVLVLQPKEGALPNDPDDRRLLDACCSSIALALERIHFVDVAQDTLVRMEGERLRNALLAAVSHDLKTPLTAIRGLAETLEQPHSLTTAEHAELAHAIRLQAEGLQRLVTNLLDLARMQSAGVRINKEWHALGEIVGSALARFGPVLDKGRVKTDLPADLPLVEVDATLLERVLVNLLDNAVKYTPAESIIRIRASALGNTMYLFVEDDGPGLPTSDIERLFAPFTRGQKESSISGVGLGLALCRTIVSAHAGTIRAEQGEPHGARFEIQLPLGAPPEIERESA